MEGKDHLLNYSYSIHSFRIELFRRNKQLFVMNAVLFCALFYVLRAAILPLQVNPSNFMSLSSFANMDVNE